MKDLSQPSILASLATLLRLCDGLFRDVSDE
jgi:hypothetical protein